MTKAKIVPLRPRMNDARRSTRDENVVRNMKGRRKLLAKRMGMKDPNLTREERLERIADLITAVVEQEALLIGATANYIDMLAQKDPEAKKELMEERSAVVKQVKDMLIIERSIRNLSKTVGSEDRAKKQAAEDAELRNSNAKDDLVDETMMKALKLLEESSQTTQELNGHINKQANGE